MAIVVPDARANALPAPNVEPTVEAPSDMPPEGNGAFGSSGWGSRGAYRVLSARPLVPGGVVLTLSDEYFSAHNVFIKGDADQQTTQRMRILWSPILGLEVGVAEVSTVNKYLQPLPRSIGVQGNPSFLVKYSRSLTPGVGVGAYINLLIPTSEFGSGLSPESLVLNASALVSYQPIHWVELSANIGYVYDQSTNLFPLGADPQQAFVYEINKVNRLAYGLSVVGDIPIQDTFTLAPYLELTGAYASGVSLANDPMRVTSGLKGYPTHGRAIEFGVGVDVRVGGEPSTTSPYAGISPWAVFGQISLHLGESLDKPVVVVVTQSAPTCTDDSGCMAGQSCQVNVCVAVQEVVKEVTKEVLRKTPTFNLTGSVLDAVTGGPIAYATVSVGGFDSVLTVDPNSGQFTVWPLAVGPDPVQLKVEAPGYLDAQQTLPRGGAGEAKQVVFKLQSDNKPRLGTLKGTLKDVRSGKPVANARIFIPVLGQRIVSGPDGGFEAQVKVGRYQVLCHAKKYLTEKKELNVRNGDVVIMNVDLRPKKRHGR